MRSWEEKRGKEQKSGKRQKWQRRKKEKWSLISTVRE